MFATHRYPLAETMAAYDTFSAAATTQALKVVLNAEPATAGAATQALEGTRV